MSQKPIPTQEVFSFHRFEVPIYKLPYYLFFYLKQKKIKGLIHSETLIPMELGESIFSKRRYHLTQIVLIAFWQTEEDLNLFLSQCQNYPIHSGWQIRLRLYRRWGKISELESATVYPKYSALETPMVAITLARLKLSHTIRFAKWGKPVEKQVRDHHGKHYAFAAFRPFRNFLTFSIWDSEKQMLQMVHGTEPKTDGLEHKNAMLERNRNDFHTEFTTLRFEILKELGRRGGIDYET
ncbi:MAG: hypothetical protein AABY22_02310 [Nanoarchaeota archaeon]|nr:hypothetical protein [Leptospira sp.]